jgi:hypothetical protein
MRPLLWSSVVWLMMSCGAPDYGEAPPQQPAPNPPPPVTKPTDPKPSGFDAVKPLIAKECGTCHNGRVHPLKLDSEAQFRGSRAKARIQNNSMPPGRALAPADKKAMLDFLNS